MMKVPVRMRAAQREQPPTAMNGQQKASANASAASGSLSNVPLGHGVVGHFTGGICKVSVQTTESFILDKLTAPVSSMASMKFEAFQVFIGNPVGCPSVVHCLEDSINGIVNPHQKVESTMHSMDSKTGRIILPAKDERVQMKSKHS